MIKRNLKPDLDDLLGHPVTGDNWEGRVMRVLPTPILKMPLSGFIEPRVVPRLIW
ncbi:MAG: hypothetical protein KDK05_00705 [Candidatus Competibacteraceae bacterium]|nr:hypothetical protein [Candidatus Competibacteraceae bacterium]MCB1808753.1 hypothetical protein [Candidatus Competibacteraceae bacterium]